MSIIDHVVCHVTSVVCPGTVGPVRTPKDVASYTALRCSF